MCEISYQIFTFLTKPPIFYYVYFLIFLKIIFISID